MSSLTYEYLALDNANAIASFDLKRHIFERPNYQVRSRRSNYFSPVQLLCDLVESTRLTSSDGSVIGKLRCTLRLEPPLPKSQLLPKLAIAFIALKPNSWFADPRKGSVN